ncbi:hypothetical protein [Cellvibrio mixtus]|uniref:hypothetical protein n=1 Tax=Cellvibrio mixtus TaxID=39650 RepID=UPI000586DAAE|nr:hypothetical protein [Cellvibrio mixtus]
MDRECFWKAALAGLIGILAVSLSACDTPDTQVSPAQKSEPRTHLAKPGASITLKTPQPFFLDTPGVGNFELVLSAPPMGGVMQVDVTAGAGLELVSSPGHFEFLLTRETDYKLPIQINAPAIGRYYVNLQASIIQNGQRDSRVITAIVQVGSPVAKPQKGGNGKSVGADGIISLPAKETIQPAN